MKGNGRLQRQNQSLCCVAFTREHHGDIAVRNSDFPSVSQLLGDTRTPGGVSEFTRADTHELLPRLENVHRKRFLTWYTQCM